RDTLRNPSFGNAHARRIEHATLNRPLQRPRAVLRIVAFLHELILRGLRQPHVDLPLLEPLHQAGELDVDDPLQVLAIERVEEDDLVVAVEDLWPEVIRLRVSTVATQVLWDIVR